MMTPFQYIQVAGGVVIVIVGGFSLGWFKILKQTNELLKEQNAELRIRNAQLEQEKAEAIKLHAENVAAIASLQGQIDILKTIPLKDINDTLVEIKTVLTTSAIQLTKDTKAASDAAKKVKSDLEAHE